MSMVFKSHPLSEGLFKTHFCMDSAPEKEYLHICHGKKALGNAFIGVVCPPYRTFSLPCAKGSQFAITVLLVEEPIRFQCMS